MYGIKEKTHVHFIGIGGIGMSGIAEILISQGYIVSGSDLSFNANVERLEKLGANISIGHAAENIKDPTVVVFSSAVSEDNPEWLASHSKGIPVVKRAEMLAEIMRLKYGIAVAGTHGKTTTTSMIATILHGCGIDPTHVIGGIVSNLNGHAKAGAGDFIVVEADESDGSFLLLNPVLSVITNIDDDHLNYYKTFENLKIAFKEFAEKIPFYGACAININDPHLRKMKEDLKKPYITFGFVEDDLIPEWSARNIEFSEGLSEFDVYHNNDFCQRATLNSIGKHNILNALGAIAICSRLEISEEEIVKYLADFHGVGRRVENLETPVGYKSKIIDDYGHHPTEVQATISAVKATAKNKLVVLFEPHRFSRTKDCWEGFLHSFNNADKVHVFDIYAASEKPLATINSERLKDDINALHPSLVDYNGDIKNISSVLDLYKNEETTILTLGAGSIGRLVRNYVDELAR